MIRSSRSPDLAIFAMIDDEMGGPYVHSGPCLTPMAHISELPARTVFAEAQQRRHKIRTHADYSTMLDSSWQHLTHSGVPHSTFARSSNPLPLMRHQLDRSESRNLQSKTILRKQQPEPIDDLPHPTSHCRFFAPRISRGSMSNRSLTDFCLNRSSARDTPDLDR
jgi:hypothetical protein